MDFAELLTTLYSLMVAALSVHGFVFLLLSLLFLCLRRRVYPASLPQVWPRVTVQLPIYNERYVARRLLGGLSVRAYVDQWVTPTDADDLAEATVRIVREGTEGLVHLAGRDTCSRYDFALEVAAAFGRSGVEPCSMADAIRPRRAEW